LKNDKLNILFLASWYPNTESTQAGNFIQQHARSITNYANVCVVHVVAVSSITEYKITKEWNNGIYEVIIYYPKPNISFPIFSLYQKGKKQQQAYLKAYELAKNELGSFDLVHLNVIYPAGLFALHLNTKYKIPYILTEHWTAFSGNTNENFNSIEKYFIKKIASKACFICPVSENLKNKMITFGLRNNYKVIPNVVDTTVFKFNQLIERDSIVKILHVSNLKDEHKNITGILTAIKTLSLKRNDFIITIAGNGDIETFKRLSTEMSISEEVIRFEGEKSSKEVAELMRKNDCFLLFSNYENLPCVISESLVMGLPVISTNVGGISEMINEKNGILIEPNNQLDLITALNYIIDNIENFDKRIISEEAQQIYSYEKVGNQFIEIYNKVLLK